MLLGWWRTIESAMTQVWPTIRFLSEHGAAMLATLTEPAVSSPREVGARMVVRPDGRFSGTIGGGALEWLVLAKAQEMVVGKAPVFQKAEQGPRRPELASAAVVMWGDTGTFRGDR